MKPWKKLIVIGCILALMLPAFGCSDEGTAEKAGKKIDQAVDDAKDSAKKMFE
ncbi:transport-associated protein [Pseudodesulfovibrio cashew]|uniref:Transport-associated protein n=1 Tax=Pseudodesulfovibrio cashew TaxID=2678688 RepID=A0A6I6JGW3_9BACT|nr:transport-associated protein [Pseudodesulfovibrio cashew]QGY39307.1 transport-associated protein [Pseudodesulfovibrio cashew]